MVTGPITITEEPESQILGDVGTLMALSSNNKYVAGMNLFTVYYYVPGNVDQTASKCLADMAKAGNGTLVRRPFRYQYQLQLVSPQQSVHQIHAERCVS